MSKNLATTTVAVAPAPATSGTSLTVAAGTGGRLYDGMAVLHPAAAAPSVANAEVVSVTVAGDVVTLVRAQESSTARAVVVGDVLTQGITAGMWDDLVASNAGKASAVHVHSATDVTSGTLPLARGGTGGTDAATARVALGLGSAATMTPATIAADPAVTGTYGPGGTAGNARQAPDWATGRAYIVGELVTSGGTLYRCVTAHTSGGSINLSNFAAIGGGGGASLSGPNTWTGAQDFTGATVTGIAGGGSGTVGSVADITALRATPISGAVSQIVRSTGDLYVPGAGSTAIDNGTTIVQPSTGSGRWLRSDPPVAVAPFGMGLARLAKARTGVFRVMQFGTSISAFDNSPNRVFTEQLKTLYGDPEESVTLGGSLGGDLSGAFRGWSKQPYGGPFYARSRGDSSSLSLSFTGRFDTVTIETSKESGGGTCVVQIDGSNVGTLDCTGAQQYSVQNVFATTLGYHTVTIQPPISGHIFLEAVKLTNSAATGVEVLDTCKGGSSLNNTGILATLGGSSVPGIAVSGNNGVDAHFGRTDLDLIICSHLVNDAGGGISQAWYDRVDRAIADTLATNTPLVWIVEMAGHFAMTASAENKTFVTMREYLLAQARKFNHVYALDWHGMTVLSDMIAYAARYYNVTALNVGAGTFTGDFIHPSTLGQRVASSALCAAFGVNPPAFDTQSAAQMLRKFPALLPVATPATVDDAARTYVGHIATANKATGGPARRLRVIEDNAVGNFGVLFNGATIPAAATSDAFGAFVNFATNTSAYFMPTVSFTRGDRVTATFRAIGNITINTDTSGTRIYDGATDIGTSASFSLPTDAPNYVTLELGSDHGNPYLGLIGKFYGVWVTRSGGVPVVTTRSIESFRRIGPPALLATDPTYDPALIGQQFVEDLGAGVLLPKKLVGSCYKYNPATQAKYLAGLYECMDRTVGGYRLGRVANGTVTADANAYTAGQADATSGTLRIDWSAVSIATAGKMTLVWRTVVAGGQSWKVALFNGGTNAKVWLQPDGTFSTNNVAAFATDPSDQGMPIAVTFDLPTGASATLGTTTPQLQLESIGGNRMSLAVLTRGSSALV